MSGEREPYVPPTPEQLAEWDEMARQTIEAQREYQAERARRLAAERAAQDDAEGANR